ncbi:hypothetical protein [Akkermansia muciniphila]|uniref:hypothetical protein n=1 Tax=Akkermansia muciniphila TaxID=239935 RepID=UPI0016517289|nr:hypothetical protein [Akkermansia muciniphila]
MLLSSPARPKTDFPERTSSWLGQDCSGWRMPSLSSRASAVLGPGMPSASTPRCC